MYLKIEIYVEVTMGGVKCKLIFVIFMSYENKSQKILEILQRLFLNNFVFKVIWESFDDFVKCMMFCELKNATLIAVDAVICWEIGMYDSRSTAI